MPAIRPFDIADLPGVVALWNGCASRGEVLYYPLTEAYFREKFLENPSYDPRLSLVAAEAGAVVGFINGVARKVFLPGETDANTPGYLTCLFVAPNARHQGVGTELLSALEDALSALGKAAIAVNSNNPINLDWIVPGSPGHDHNNAPGVDEGCAGYPFLLSRGYAATHHEVAMYLDLKRYIRDPELEEKRARLRCEGVYTGRYDPKLGYDFDRMCDRVGSEYWRKILKDEVAKENPRVILAATHEKHIVGFTGPVDLQPSGRGWFSGICTDPQYERRGIASVLFNLLMQEFILEGAAFSTLFTGTDNHAQRVYSRTGMRPVRRFAMLRKPL